MVAHTFNPSAREADLRELNKASQSYTVRVCLKNKEMK